MNAKRIIVDALRNLNNDLYEDLDIKEPMKDPMVDNRESEKLINVFYVIFKKSNPHIEIEKINNIEYTIINHLNKINEFILYVGDIYNEEITNLAKKKVREYIEDEPFIYYRDKNDLVDLVDSEISEILSNELDYLYERNAEINGYESYEEWEEKELEKYEKEAYDDIWKFMEDYLGLDDSVMAEYLSSENKPWWLEIDADNIIDDMEAAGELFNFAFRDTIYEIEGKYSDYIIIKR